MATYRVFLGMTALDEKSNGYFFKEPRISWMGVTDCPLFIKGSFFRIMASITEKNTKQIEYRNSFNWDGCFSVCIFLNKLYLKLFAPEDIVDGKWMFKVDKLGQLLF
jgi:hypothetical protein